MPPTKLTQELVHTTLDYSGTMGMNILRTLFEHRLFGDRLIKVPMPPNTQTDLEFLEFITTLPEELSELEIELLWNIYYPVETTEDNYEKKVEAARRRVKGNYINLRSHLSKVEDFRLLVNKVEIFKNSIRLPLPILDFDEVYGHLLAQWQSKLSGKEKGDKSFENTKNLFMSIYKDKVTLIEEALCNFDYDKFIEILESLINYDHNGDLNTTVRRVMHANYEYPFKDISDSYYFFDDLRNIITITFLTSGYKGTFNDLNFLDLIRRFKTYSLIPGDVISSLRDCTEG